MSINTQALILRLLLDKNQHDSETILTDFESAKPDYFSESYRKIRTHIAGFHEKFSKLPTLGELRVQHSRSNTVLSSLTALERFDVPEDVDLTVAIAALENEYAQQLTLSTFRDLILKDVTMLESQEIVDRLAEMQTIVMESLDNSEHVFTSKTLNLFQSDEDANLATIKTEISKAWDEKYGAIRREELLLLGGKRGSGKSILCTNFAAKQYKMGNVSVYFTIEMKAGETFERFMAVIAGVDAMEIRNKTISGDALMQLVTTRANMFVGGQEVLDEFLESYEGDYVYSDFAVLERELVKLPETEPAFIIIDDSQLKLSSVGAHIGALKAKYGDKLTLGIVDYVNQVIVGDQSDMYDWKDQLQVAKGLKNIARKYELGMVSPYQIDDDGGARLSKAILDPADYAMVIHAHEDTGIITLDATKVRSISNVTFNIPMEWNTLTLSSEDITEETVGALINFPAPSEQFYE